ncbi:MAG: type II secretion system protein GspE [Candidatus Omnitrophica bacterium CG11_big_fil_rev_8_21_14_0_20_42_13]|uniref:Type II secretion system protein GspE n=1 Tax=Candidatus Ghiorseimicrobium undicola TaxID=1974746 RepID=A0A2H0LWB1_9BACT|nr:MAG: type II secretion system protein GspE [Candidatus Omnitrophica bacterium CG11_big_fil_rev_8_21_14_0_20_42_13]
MARAYLKLGEILIKDGLITEDQLNQALAIQAEHGGRIGEVLVNLKLVTEQNMIAAIAKQLSIPYVSLGTGHLKPAVDQGLEELIPRDYAVKHFVLPLSRNLNSLTCAISDPFDLLLLDNLKKMTGCEINPVIATSTDIETAIDKFYEKASIFKQAIQESYKINKQPYIKDESEEDGLSLDKLIEKAEEAPVVKLVDLIISQAIEERASDIHIEPFKDRISLRYRIDGKLYEIPPPAKHLHLPILSRIKILSNLNIAEKRLPQGGAFFVKIKNRNIDLRVSTIPTIYGEKMVLRILDKESVNLDLSALGFDDKQLADFKKGISAPYGLVFLTGPTGSGKTTTLYAAINAIKSPHKNIVTVEDPVEYRLDGVNQVQIKPDIGLTFAEALRTFLRQDPDVMLVGEVRDLETAQICVRSALTGHLVFSTLHTNDATSAITRLIDIGIESYLLLPSLIMIVAQRLVRKLCPHCKEAYEPEHKKIGTVGIRSDLIYRAKGCDQCANMGYKGRICISEVLLVSNEILDALSEGISLRKVNELARRQNVATLFESGIRKVEQGLTTLEEVMSVALET